MSERDGGSAFPMQFDDVSSQFGMTLRDYFAIHSTQPGIAEIAKVAGVGYVSGLIYTQEQSAIGERFDDWWGRMSLQLQCDLSAAVRYAQADAMLRERAK